MFIKGRKVTIPLIITVVAVALASPALQTTPAQAEPIWPTSWMIIDEDANEAGTGDDYRDVQTALYNYDDDYLYLRLCLYAAPDFSGPSRYKWFIDLGAGDPLNLSGGSIFGADYLLFTEDGDDDSTGEVYVLPDTDSDGAFSEYEPTQYITTPGPVTDPTIAGYRFDDNCVDMYIKLSELGRSNPFSINLAWSTDTENPNLEQASTQDRIDELDIPIYIESLVNVSITDTPDPADAGSELTYTITYANTGTDNAAGVVITHTLPTEVTFVSAEPAPTSVSAGELIWDIGELAPDGTHTITVCVTVNSPIPDGTVITNSANMTSSIGASSDAEETTISSAPILAIEKEDAPDPVRAGRGLTYTIVYENTGNEIAHDVVIADQLPPEVAYDSANPLPTTVSDTSLTWEIGELSPEDGPQIIIVYTDVHRGTPRGTILENKVDITCSQEVTADATATTRVTVRRPSPSPSPAPRPEPIPPSEPEPEPSPPPEPAPVPPPLPEPSPPSPPVILPNVSADDIVPLSVELVNHGPSAAPFCTLECVLPNEMHIIEASVAPKGSLSILGNKITGALGTIEVGDSTIINMNAEVAGTVEADTPIDELLRQTTLNLSNQPILEDMSLSGLITEDLVIRLGERKYWQYVTFVKKIGEEANISTKLTRIRNLEGAFSIIMRVYGEVWDTQEIATGDDLGQETEHEIDLKINGEVWQTKTLTFQPGETQELVFNVHNLPKERLRLPGNFTLPWWIVPSGAYFVEVNGVQGEVSSAWWIRWWLITIISGVIVGLIWLSIIRRKNRRKTHD